MDHVAGFGLSGWRWMLLLEGGPAMLAGIFNFWIMADGPEKAKWLTHEERGWLVEELSRDQASRKNVKHFSLWQAVSNSKVLYLSVIYFIYQVGNLGIGLWMPQIIRGFSSNLSNFEIGLLAMIPYAVATVAMVLWSRNSDRTGERQKHTAVPLLAAAIALAATGYFVSPAMGLILISIALAGLYAFKSPFWSLPSLFLTRSTAAVSIAAINSIGNLGGFVGPYAIGYIKDWTGSALGGLLFLAGLILLSFFMAWFAVMTNPPQPAGQAAGAHA
jgi:ACS family tartrate transporter-like MFS transporter